MNLNMNYCSKKKMLLIIFTDNSVYNIDKHIIYSILVIDFCNYTWNNINFHTYFLLHDKIIIIINEISMISLTLLHIINQQCNRIQTLQQNFMIILNNFSIIIFFDNFHQFLLIRIQSLWQTLNSKISDIMINQLIWHQFTNIIFLDEQMH